MKPRLKASLDGTFALIAGGSLAWDEVSAKRDIKQRYGTTAQVRIAEPVWGAVDWVRFPKADAPLACPE